MKNPIILKSIQGISWILFVVLCTTSLYRCSPQTSNNPQPAFTSIAVVSEPQIDQKEKQCLVEALWYEARGESETSMLAVANVIQNRVQSGKYPDSYCKVISQPMQFSYKNHKIQKPVPKNNKDQVALAKIDLIATNTINNKTMSVVPKHVLYYAGALVNNYWTKKKTLVSQIGKHKFYS